MTTEQMSAGTFSVLGKVCRLSCSRFVSHPLEKQSENDNSGAKAKHLRCQSQTGNYVMLRRSKNHHDVHVFKLNTGSTCEQRGRADRTMSSSM